MYRTLFDLAGLANIGWIPLIFVPLWRGTRRLAESRITRQRARATAWGERWDPDTA
jgi:hypothetical protein